MSKIADFLQLKRSSVFEVRVGVDAGLIHGIISCVYLDSEEMDQGDVVSVVEPSEESSLLPVKRRSVNYTETDSEQCMVSYASKPDNVEEALAKESEDSSRGWLKSQ